MKNNTPITDAVATLIIMLALIAGGYFWLKHESDKILDKSYQHRHNPAKDTSVLKEYAPKTFEALSKHTE